MSTNDKPTPVPDASAEARQAPTLPPDMLIILPVRNMVLFPGVVMPVAIKREKTVAGAQEAVRTEAKVGFLLQKKPHTEEPGFDDLHRVGTVASIVRYLTAPDGTLTTTYPPGHRNTLWPPGDTDNPDDNRGTDHGSSP